MHWICMVILPIAWTLGTQSHVNEKQCASQDTCKKCLSANCDCSWCTDKMYDGRHRCLTRDELIMNGCAESNIWFNAQKISIEKDAERRDYQDDHIPARQVRPQRIQMKLVKSQTQQIKLTYSSAENNPLDLYFLMDATWTMRDDKKTLVKMGAQLSAVLRNLTSNYRIGFGSFADKPTMPMIMPNLKENPCSMEHQTCEPIYGFRHHLELTEDTDNFIQLVSNMRGTGNLDDREGGLDALMQVIVCPEKVGWKKEANKIVLLPTDGFMHFAGDGLLAGITRRNDRKCHLNETGEYNGSLIYDYPSLEEMYRELLRRQISVIFAVTPKVLKEYQQITAVMNEISYVVILSSNSSNILELIEAKLGPFSTGATFIDDSPPFLHLTYETTCGGQLRTLRQQNYCKDLEMGKMIEFYINVTLEDFPDDGVYHSTIRIQESGSAYLELEIEIQKPCPCDEDPITDEHGRKQCNNNGVLQCGMCRCDDGWGGAFCSCNSNNGTTTQSIERQCQQPHPENPLKLGPFCSNQGECDCGTCNCFTGYNGKYCECPECEHCDPDNADCFCGKCVCKYGWSGEHCNCNPLLEKCKTLNGEICSGRGECQCGKCICKDQYDGRCCEIGWQNDNNLCQYYEPCVKCLIHQKLGTFYCENVTDVCSSSNREMFGYAFVTESIAPDRRCVVRLINSDEVNCEHFYSYELETGSSGYLKIYVNTDCTPFSAFVMGAILVLCLFIIGIILVVIDCRRRRQADARQSLIKSPVVEYNSSYGDGGRKMDEEGDLKEVTISNIDEDNAVNQFIPMVRAGPSQTSALCKIYIKRPFFY